MSDKTFLIPGRSAYPDNHYLYVDPVVNRQQTCLVGHIEGAGERKCSRKRKGRSLTCSYHNPKGSQKGRTVGERWFAKVRKIYPAPASPYEVQGPKAQAQVAPAPASDPAPTTGVNARLRKGTAETLLIGGTLADLNSLVQAGWLVVALS
jgi:hypothetical protein